MVFMCPLIYPPTSSHPPARCGGLRCEFGRAGKSICMGNRKNRLTATKLISRHARTRGTPSFWEGGPAAQRGRTTTKPTEATKSGLTPTFFFSPLIYPPTSYHPTARSGGLKCKNAPAGKFICMAISKNRLTATKLIFRHARTSLSSTKFRSHRPH